MKHLTLLIVTILLLDSCHKNHSASTRLEWENAYDINVPEPSGLASTDSENVLLSVSDQTNMVYKMTLTGQIIQTYNYTGHDLEGITGYTSGTLLLVEERNKNIIELNTLTGVSHIHSIAYENEEANSGMEGIAYNPNTQTIYFLNEKRPGKLFRLNTNYSITNSIELDFAQDYSGIVYDADADVLWILSDESQSINKCTLDGMLIQSYSIQVHKPEGICIIDDKIYIVSDSEEKLYIFPKPD